MTATTEEHRAEARRATARAKACLKPGDRIWYTMCGGRRGHALVVGWSGDWIRSATRDDIHALHVYRVNGATTSFADGGPG